MNKALEEAANWYARMHAPDWRLDERREFRAWLERCPENARAYAAAEQLTEVLSQAADNARLRAMAEQAMAETAEHAESAKTQVSSLPWLRPASMAIAASLVLCAFLMFLVSESPGFGGHMVVLNTPLGEQREVTLDDGTLTRLDTDSALMVKMSAKVRDVTLIKGRAIFEVTHDAQRPFSVSVGEGRIKALGTRFQVQSFNKAVIVTLEEGSVDVTNTVNGRYFTQRMMPGEQLRFTQGVEGWMKAAIDTDVATSWAKGRHVFRGSKLIDAINEINRYSARKVRLGDSSLANMAVSGNFILGDSSSIVSAFTEAFPLRVVEAGSELVLFPYYSQADYRQADYVR